MHHATNGSVIDRVMEIARGWQIIPEISFINNFVEHPLFLQAWAELGQEMMAKQDYDNIPLSPIMDFPERQIRKGSVEGYCQLAAAVINMGRKISFATGVNASTLPDRLAAKLGLPEEK